MTTEITNPNGSIDMTVHQGTTSRLGITLSENTVTTVRELLNLTDEFLRTASPTVHAELRAYLHAQVPPADPGWFIDLLGLNAMHLARQLPASAPSARETWTERRGQNS